jgi:5,5'-dehydrodivanillate O-demethylase
VNHHKRIGFDVFEHGIIKRRVYEGFSEEDADWAVGHPILFPQHPVRPEPDPQPIDDTRALHVDYVVRPLPADVLRLTPTIWWCATRR